MVTIIYEFIDFTLNDNDKPLKQKYNFLKIQTFFKTNQPWGTSIICLKMNHIKAKQDT